MLPGLENFLQTCQWETEHPALESKLNSLYFSEILSDDCKKFEWIMNPFIYKDYQKYNLDGHSEDKLI